MNIINAFLENLWQFVWICAVLVVFSFYAEKPNSVIEFLKRIGSSIALTAILAFVTDGKGIQLENLAWGQFGTVFLTIMIVGIANERPITFKSVIEVAKGATAIVLIFAFLSGGKGCTSGNGSEDCRPAGPGIYNDC